MLEWTSVEEGLIVAFKYSKGWFIKQLKEQGITKHPVDRKKLELYKTYIIRNLYSQLIEKDQGQR
jgi:hypothetical protein